MLTRSSKSLLSVSDRHKIIPVIENRSQFLRALNAPQISTIFLRHCNLLDLRPNLDQAFDRDLAVYVYVDHIDGIHPDSAGLRFLAHQLHITGIVSSNPRILSLGKGFELETIQRLFAVDSTGIETALDSVDDRHVDLLDISPALVIPYVVSHMVLPLPFIGSGLISTFQQVQSVLRAGALRVTTARSELYM
ncbi:MAG TPA: glycerol-3-phosphate responsive antiterminator [Ktedonobacteraceae bacterium]|nr:glycerol-3-phosphate responsive antiterminator [Ktedonobacteraceae bacterium]